MDGPFGTSDVCDLEADTERTCRIGQAGTAMHTECVGIVLAYVLTRGNMSVSELKGTHQLGKLVPERSHAQIAGCVSAVAVGGLDARPKPARNQQVQLLSSSLLGMAAMIAGQRSTKPKPKRD